MQRINLGAISRVGHRVGIVKLSKIKKIQNNLILLTIIGNNYGIYFTIAGLNNAINQTVITRLTLVH